MRPVGTALLLLAVAQAGFGGRVLARLARTATGERVRAVPLCGASGEARVSVILPVLNEVSRLAPCLDGLLAQGEEVREILVVDGGSTDGTLDLVAGYAGRDTRVRLIDATPIPPDWNGKAWGLQVGLGQSAPESDWVLTVDADVRPQPGLTPSLVAHAQQTGIPALSLATVQELSGWDEGLIHPALLTTLVYRLGSPGGATRRVDAVQANGQCFLCRRDVLVDVGGYVSTRTSRCEDVTLARHLAAAGHAVGFYESEVPVYVRMYASGWEAWQNWPRSLPLRDQYAGASPLLGLLEVSLVQALPFPLLLGLILSLSGRWGHRAAAGKTGAPAGAPVARSPWLHGARLLVTLLPPAVNGGLVAVRLGVLVGTARAYRGRPWSYWLSPLCDVPVAVALWHSLFRRRHVWRGRTMISGEAA